MPPESRQARKFQGRKPVKRKNYVRASSRNKKEHRILKRSGVQGELQAESQDFNFLKPKKNLCQSFKPETRKNTEYLKDVGYKVTEIYECQWRKMKSSDPKSLLTKVQLFAFLQNFNFLKPIYGMNEQILLSAIQNGKIFGMVLCDIKTPKHLNLISYFSEFCPIFKNVEVGREDIGDLMEKFAVDNNLLSKPQKMLIGSYFADKILLILHY